MLLIFRLIYVFCLHGFWESDDGVTALKGFVFHFYRSWNLLMSEKGHTGMILEVFEWRAAFVLAYSLILRQAVRKVFFVRKQSDAFILTALITGTSIR